MTPPNAIAFGFSLLVNAALLLSLVMLIDLTLGRRTVRLLERPNAMAGVGVGAVGVLLMAVSTTLMTGIIFDTRSVLLAISGLMLGPLPTAVAVVMTASYRVWLGGAWQVGVSVIVASAALGLLWRHRLHKPIEALGKRELFTLGLAVHAAMLGLMLFLPDHQGPAVLARVSLPVLLIYPAFTAALGMLLIERLRRERSLEALEEREARYHSLFDDTRAVMLLLDPDTGRILDANAAAVQFYGWPREELLAKKIGEINTLPPDEIRAAMQASRTHARQHFDFCHRLADGSVRNIESFASPIHLNGKDYLYAIIQDVTQRKAAEAELSATRQRLEMALSAARQGIFDVDLRTGVVVFSEDYARTFDPRITQPQTTVDAWLENTHPDDRARVVAVGQGCADGNLSEYSFEYRQRRADGSWAWVLSVGKVVERDAEGHALRMVGTHTDVTERKRAEEELRQRNEELQRFNEAMVGRELDMVRLKQKVNALCLELGREPAYPLRFLESGFEPGNSDTEPGTNATPFAPSRHGT